MLQEFGPEFRELEALWPRLNAAGRGAVLAAARALAGLPAEALAKAGGKDGAK